MRKGVLTLVVFAGFLIVGTPGASAYIYWHSYDSGNGKIGRADLDGANIKPDLVQGTYFGGGVASDGTHVYWGESGSSPTMAHLGRANIDGTEPDHNYYGGASYCGIFGLQANLTHLFWLKSTCSGTPNRAIDWVDIPGKNGYSESGASDYICGFAVDSNYVYWSKNQYIARAPLLGGLPDETWLDTGAGKIPCAVAVDSGHVYWTNTAADPPTGYRGRTIGRASIDGSEASVNNSFITGTVFISGISTPPGLAVDSGHIYWTNQPDYSGVPGPGAVDGSIGRAALDGTDVNQFFVPSVFFPVGLAIDNKGPAPAPPGGGGNPPPYHPPPQLPPRFVSVGSSNSSFTPSGKSTPVRGQTGIRAAVRVRASSSGIASARVPVGTTFTFKLTLDASVTVDIQKKKAGRLKKRTKCVKPSGKLKSKPKCSLSVAKLFRTSKAGVNKLPFTGRIKGKALKPGKYQAVFTARDSAGTSKTAKVNFTIVR